MISDVITTRRHRASGQGALRRKLPVTRQMTGRIVAGCRGTTGCPLTAVRSNSAPRTRLDGPWGRFDAHANRLQPPWRSEWSRCGELASISCSRSRLSHRARLPQGKRNLSWSSECPMQDHARTPRGEDETRRGSRWCRGVVPCQQVSGPLLAAIGHRPVQASRCWSLPRKQPSRSLTPILSRLTQPPSPPPLPDVRRGLTAGGNWRIEVLDSIAR